MNHDAMKRDGVLPGQILTFCGSCIGTNACHPHEILLNRNKVRISSTALFMPLPAWHNTAMVELGKPETRADRPHQFEFPHLGPCIC